MSSRMIDYGKRRVSPQTHRVHVADRHEDLLGQGQRAACSTVSRNSTARRETKMTPEP